MNIGERIKLKRLSKNKTLEWLAEQLNTTRQTIHRYESGEISNIPSDKIEQIAKALDTTPSFIMGWDELNNSIYEAPKNKVEIVGQNLYLNIPLYESLSCGTGLFVDDNVIEYITLPETLLNTNKEYFCQYATGDSMINENINEGDLLVFEKSQLINNGQIGCFCIDDNIATCKKFYKDYVSAIITLQPANPKYPPIIVTVETMNFHVVGKLSLVINKRD